MLITVSGPPGAGTTSTAKHVASELGLELVLGGEVFRSMAAEHRLSLAEFGEHAAENPAIDLELDRRLLEQARRSDALIESRLAAWLVADEGLKATSVWLECEPRTRARRVADRDGIDMEEALRLNTERETLERRRYMALYSFDLDDLSIYDLVLETSVLNPIDAAQRIVDRAGIQEV